MTATPLRPDGTIAYFSMEYGLENGMNTYNGGLGILAGDVVRGFADLSVDAVGLTLVNDRGLGRQHLDEDGVQHSVPAPWSVEEFCEPLDETVTVSLGDEEVTVGAWQYDVVSEHGGTVPVVMLDADREENSEWAGDLTHRVYAPGRDERFRLAQELVLGVGGVRMLDALGYDVDTYHMNEGHASFLTLELLGEADLDADAVRDRCVFTTHTPVAAAHEQYPYDLLADLAGDLVPMEAVREHTGANSVHTTRLALNLSRYVNAVSKRHQEVSRAMFPDHADAIDAVTNGAHVPTWVGDHVAAVFDEHVRNWRRHPSRLAHAALVDDEDLWGAHQAEKGELIDYVRERQGIELDPDVLTLGFARRAVPYKRATLLFEDVDRLREVVARAGDLQVVFAGKAFPGDPGGKAIVEEIHRHAADLRDEVTVVYLEDYDMEMGHRLTAGVDVWLNNPRRPREASGTSGMKAAFNGVPQFSTVDGWWVEGHIEGATGWAIGPDPHTDREERLTDELEDLVDATALYDALESEVLPTYYGDREAWVDVMRNAVAFNGSRYHARRMVEEYLADAYAR
ncbi:MAG: alpha-glucan family phosphorylase [Haloarculaceae archaeon]